MRMTTFEQGFAGLQNIPHSGGRNVQIQLWKNSQPNAQYPEGRRTTKIATLRNKSGIQEVGVLSTDTPWTMTVKIPYREQLQGFAVHMSQDPLGNQYCIEFSGERRGKYFFYDFPMVLRENHMTFSGENQLYIVLQGTKGKFYLYRVCCCFQNDHKAYLTVQFLMESQLETIMPGEFYLTKQDGIVVARECTEEEAPLFVCQNRLFAEYHGLLGIFQKKFARRSIPKRIGLISAEELLETNILSTEEAMDRYSPNDLQGHPMRVEFFNLHTNTGWGTVEIDAGVMIPVKFHFEQIPRIEGRVIKFLEPGDVVYPRYGIYTHQQGPFEGCDHFNATGISLTPQEVLAPTLNSADAYLETAEAANNG